FLDGVVRIPVNRNRTRVNNLLELADNGCRYVHDGLRPVLARVGIGTVSITLQRGNRLVRLYQFLQVDYLRVAVDVNIRERSAVVVNITPDARIGQLFDQLVQYVLVSHDCLEVADHVRRHVDHRLRPVLARVRVDTVPVVRERGNRLDRRHQLFDVFLDGVVRSPDNRNRTPVNDLLELADNGCRYVHDGLRPVLARVGIGTVSIIHQRGNRLVRLYQFLQVDYLRVAVDVNIRERSAVVVNITPDARIGQLFDQLVQYVLVSHDCLVVADHVRRHVDHR